MWCPRFFSDCTQCFSCFSIVCKLIFCWHFRSNPTVCYPNKDHNVSLHNLIFMKWDVVNSNLISIILCCLSYFSETSSCSPNQMSVLRLILVAHVSIETYLRHMLNSFCPFIRYLPRKINFSDFSTQFPCGKWRANQSVRAHVFGHTFSDICLRIYVYGHRSTNIGLGTLVYGHTSMDVHLRTLVYGRKSVI